MIDFIASLTFGEGLSLIILLGVFVLWVEVKGRDEQ
jgi:hypothetical protein|tara:strand:- start:327 stop:434 length:108 start_codon:yes stop_codon:yes gene_type:complete